MKEPPPVRQDVPYTDVRVGDVTLSFSTQRFQLERSAEPGVFDAFTLAEPIGAVGHDPERVAFAMEVATQVLQLSRRLLVEAREEKAKPEDDEKLCEDAARQWLKTRGGTRDDRAIKAVEHALDNNDYDHEYKAGRDKSVAVVKRGLKLIGKSAEWPERAYPKTRKLKFPRTR